MAEPLRIPAGSSSEWTRTNSTYTAGDGYSLSYELTNFESAETFTHTSASGSTYTVTLTPTDTSSWVPGDYTWNVFATKSGEKWHIASGSMVVAPNLSNVDFYDGRSDNKKTLDGIILLIDGRTKDGVDTLSIGNRSLGSIPIPELLTWKTKYEQFVRDEEDAQRVSEGYTSRREIRVWNKSVS